MSNRVFLLISMGLLVAAVFILSFELGNLNNSTIIARYLSNHCELLENQAETQQWYECNK